MRAFDKYVRKMAAGERVQLPADYDSRLRAVYEALPEREPADVRCRRGRPRVSRLAAAAAVVVLMAVSFAVGALAFGTETVVEVPEERESITLEALGLTLLLPDTWEGRYAVEQYGEEYHVYCPEIREACGGDAETPLSGGVLFYILGIDEVLTPEQIADSQWNFAANRYLFTTRDTTYLLYYASDVQFTRETMEEYREMEAQIGDIRIIVDSVLQ